MTESDQARTRRGAAPTLEDVARAAGVSRQTVSNVLNAPQRVRPDTRQRVEQFIDRLGYQPNRIAQALRANDSRMIGYRFKPLTHHALASIHDRFLHALSEWGATADRHLLLFSAPDTAAEVEMCAKLRRSGAAEAFVLYDIEADDDRPTALLERGLSFVAFGRTASGTDQYSWVDVDNTAGIEAAVAHLAERGHRRIGYVGLPEGHNVGGRRAQGWHKAIARRALNGNGLDVRGPDTVASGTELAFGLLGQPDPPTAVVAATDTLAVGVMRAALQWGLDVGRDLAVVGFDDTPTAAALDLSSIRQPIEDVGREVMSVLATLGPRPDAFAPAATLLTPSLTVRSSSASRAPQR
ncbi:LacI family transcriptional regulator [Streptomyces sp. SLBN-118]|uniref:LacI family DNA-binding transcriptional regulator n=1 Tax=Streptomyces sp. SLBN-118 TaxID=2768454 RepID=UPI00116D29E8|nr:LacI family DNA-binding transcriptional regulator [Streptomyces sp. SLBN-118]TQK50752.1 LacI family transcriptional regulator [Streptomyces sp. SLBN-118]